MRKILKKMCIALLLLFASHSIFAGKVAVFPNLKRPHQLAVDNDQIYIIDGGTIYIYSLKDFVLKKKFGKVGEGPQEFKEWSQKKGIVFDAHDDRIVVTSRGKISLFLKNGECEKEIKTMLARNVQAIGKQFIGSERSYSGKVLFYKLYQYSSEMERLNFIFEKESHIQLRQGKGWTIFAAPFEFCVNDNKIYVAAEDDFVIRVFDSKGKSLLPIRMEYKKLKLSVEQKKGIYDYLKTDPLYRDSFERIKKITNIPDYFAAIRKIKVADGNLYVETYRKSGEKTEFFIFDKKGKLLKQVFLPIVEYNLENSFPYAFKNGKLYQLIENEDEEYELHVTLIK